MRFAIINNTYGESPYSGLGPKVNSTIKEINEDNPVFLVHLGGFICGGTEWQGITKIDIDRQYMELFSAISGLLPIFYTVKGDTDLFNNSSDYYLKYSKREDYYSFNYGDLHFLVLDSTGNGLISEKQEHWIRKDLIYAKDSAAIFVFVHHTLSNPGKNKSPGSGIIDKDYKILHEYFTKYPVKAVFSGNSPLFFKYDIDGISYINTGCGGFNRNDKLNKYCQYYIVDYKNGEFSVQPRYVTNPEKQ